MERSRDTGSRTHELRWKVAAEVAVSGQWVKASSIPGITGMRFRFIRRDVILAGEDPACARAPIILV